MIPLNEPSVTLLSSEGWYHFGQLFIDSTYLQPLKYSLFPIQQKQLVKKANTHNGYIEREIHGAMHASRVAWSTIMLHRLCQQQYPSEVKNKVQALVQFSRLNEDELFYLLRYVSLGHDAARESEGNDSWEKESAASIENFLSEHGLSQKLAKIFSILASLKDKPQEFANFLVQYSLTPEAIDGLNYARLLISLADCYDIIRCISVFEFSYVEQKLSEVFQYSKEKDAPVFFEYTKQLLHTLQQQKDLYFPTELMDPDGHSYSLDESEEDYSVHIKVKLEHADNAIAAMLDSLNRNLYFKNLLSTAIPQPIQLYNQEPVFNPYIHGTNSLALALMTKTNFQLMSPIKMLEHYQLAPLSGEIVQGGLAHARSNGDPCFARLNGEENDLLEYSLHKIIRNYSKVDGEAKSKEYCIKELLGFTFYGPGYLFSSISIINIYLARANQLGVNLKEVPQLKSLEEDIQRTIDIFYLYLLFSTHIVAKNKVNDIKEILRMETEIKKNLSLPIVLEKLKQHNISIREIYNNPTAENCQQIVNLLTFSEKDKVKQLFEYTDKPLIETTPESPKSLFFNLNSIIQNQKSYSFESMIHDTWSYYKMGDFQRLAPKLLQYINDFEKRFGITKKLLHKPQNSLIFSSEDYDLVANPLPLILVYDNHRYIRIVSMKYQEYCALKSLKLGKDIQTIATDTEANVKRLQAYSKRHQLALRIISFADLKRAHNSLTFEYPLSREQILNRPSGIKMLNDFCDEQQKRFTEDWITNSLIDFQEAAKTIILSDRSPEEKRVQLKKYANDEFKHRHYLPRLLADILILLSSPLLIGLSVGIINRVLNGHSFFFSFEKTKRETEFDKIADRMKLDY